MGTSKLLLIRQSLRVLVTLMILLSTGMSMALAHHSNNPNAHLVQMGPMNPDNGFPLWYKDGNGLRMQLCLDPQDPLCAFPAGEVPDETQPISFPDNYPGEAFYQLAEASMTTGTGGDALITLALEAAFSTEVPIQGDQIVFGRVRIRVDGLQPNTEYTITHPYGVDKIMAETDDGESEINYTEDRGVSIGNPQMAMTSRIGPFLQWDPNVGPAAPQGYIGDPNVSHPVVGSVHLDRNGQPQNYFRIEGPGIGIGSPNSCGNNCIQTNLFTLMGKKAVNGGVDIEKAYYNRNEAGTTIDVFATSLEEPQLIEVSGTGLTTTGLEGRAGNYFNRVPYSGSGKPDEEIQVANVGDTPPSIKTIKPVDFVSAKATYTFGANTLTVTANSSDKVQVPTMSVDGFTGSFPAGGTLTIEDVGAPPALVTVKSSAGGSITIPVEVSESIEPAPVADAGTDQTVPAGANVTLSGALSSGNITSYTWTQTSGEAPVEIIGADTAVPSFTAPNTAGTLVFSLTVEGPGGTSTDTVTVQVTAPTPAAPVANAGADQNVLTNVPVSLNGSNSTGNITTYAWTQTAGTPVTLTGANTATPSFTAPNAAGTLTFSLTVQGPGGSASDTVTVQVNAPTPAAPAANAGADQTVLTNAPVSLNGSGSTGNITTYAWTQTAGTPVTLTGANTATPNFTAPDAAGTLTFRLTVQGPGGSASDTVTVQVNAPTPAAPAANAGADQTVLANASVSLNGSGSTGNITTYAWTQTAGTPVTLTGANTATPSFTAPDAAGALTFRLTVQGPGGSASDTVTVQVNAPTPDAPVANAGVDQTVVTGANVTLSGTQSSGTIDSYAWTQTGGTPVTLNGADRATPSFTAPGTAGTLTFELRVQGPGGSASDTVTVQVNAPTTEPVINPTVKTARVTIVSGLTNWQIVGTAAPGTTVTIHNGSDTNAPVLATKTAASTGDWNFTNLGPAPNAANMVTVVFNHDGTTIVKELAVIRF